METLWDAEAAMMAKATSNDSAASTSLSVRNANVTDSSAMIKVAKAIGTCDVFIRDGRYTPISSTIAHSDVEDNWQCYEVRWYFYPLMSRGFVGVCFGLYLRYPCLVRLEVGLRIAADELQSSSLHRDHIPSSRESDKCNSACRCRQ